MAEATVSMCLIKYYVLIFFALFVYCHALNCKSDGGLKQNELKTIYRNCLKKQGSSNSSNNRGYSSDDDWRDPHGYNNHRSQWDRDRMGGRDDRISSKDDRMGSRDDRMGSRGDITGSRHDRMGNRDDRSSSRDDRMRNDRFDNRDDMIGERNLRMGTRDDRMGREERIGGSRNDGFGRSGPNGRDDFAQSDEFGSDIYNNYRSTTQVPRRFKREKHVQINSGQRSQYNPNPSSTPRTLGYEDSYRNDEKNSSDNFNKSADNKACALHCFLENLEMIGDNGMPDRYLVTHAITKDVKNEDLRDFLQESIEECFQILDNEDAQDKCEFSKNLLMCLSEKGRANCDDWKDDIQF